MTCDELAACWPDRWPRPDLSTNQQHRRMTRGFGRHFAYRDLWSITRSEARAWAMVHPSQARYVRTMYNDAIDEGLCEDNPFSELRLPKAIPKEIVVPSEEEVGTLWRAALADPKNLSPLATAIPFAAYTGVREAELRAVEKGEFSDDYKRCGVYWQLTRDDRKKQPKGKSGAREIVVPRYALTAAQAAVHEARDDRLWTFSRDQRERMWKTVRIETGIWIRWHDLRHFAATWFLDHGATPEDVALQLGHDDNGEMVRKLYGHPNRAKALDRLESCVES